MSIWYDGTDLNMFQGDTGSIIFSGLPLNKKYKGYFGVTSVSTRNTIFEVNSDVGSFWFDKNGNIIKKEEDETDEQFEQRMKELSELKEAFNIGCTVIYISPELSNKLIVAKSKDSAEYYFAFKLCNEDGTVEDTIIPKVYIDENNQLVFPEPPKIIVRPKYVQGMYECYSTYDTNPELVHIALDLSKLDDVTITVDGMTEVSDYGKLTNKPSINGVVLEGNLTSKDLNLVSKEDVDKLVSTEKQTLTSEQRKQARENIGAISLVGESNPTPATRAEYVGQTYTNTNTGDMFYCSRILVNSYEWVMFNQTQRGFVFEQPTDLAQWNIKHMLKKFPSVTVVNTAGAEHVGDVNYLNENELIITFSIPFSGKAFLN